MKTSTTDTRRAANMKEIENDAWERVPYFERKPEGLAKSETHFVVTLNGVNYRYAYNTELMIPRCIKEILDSRNETLKRADKRANMLLANDGGGVNLGTYGN